MPSRQELLEAYEAGVGEATKDITWFDALTSFKEASATGLIGKLARRRNPDGPDMIAPTFCTDLIARTHEILGR